MQHESVTFPLFRAHRKGNRYGLEFIAENDADYMNTGELQEGLAAMAAGRAAGGSSPSALRVISLHGHENPDRLEND